MTELKFWVTVGENQGFSLGTGTGKRSLTSFCQWLEAMNRGLMLREVRIRHWNVPNVTFTRPDGHLRGDLSCSQNPRRQRMMKTGSDVLRPSNAALLLVLRSCSTTGSSLYYCGISLHLRLLLQCDPSWSPLSAVGSFPRTSQQYLKLHEWPYMDCYLG